MTGHDPGDVAERAREMIARLERDWREAGMPPGDRERLALLAREVMARRSGRFADEHHPAFLHPLRTVLILLEAGETDPRAHAAALLLHTESEGSGIGREVVPVGDEGPARGIPADAAEVFGAPEGERVERLLLAEPWVRRTWLAERLDQLRHLHLWAGPERTRRALERAGREDAPLAAREGGRLHRAWADWMDKARRFHLADRAETRTIDA